VRNIEVRWNGNVTTVIQRAAEAAIRETSLRLAEATIDEVTIYDLIDTGALRASIFVGHDGTVISTRESAIAKASIEATSPGKKSGRTFTFGEHVASETWKPTTKLQTKVGISANYANAIHNRKRNPIKFFRKAFEEVFPEVPKIFGKHFKSLK
jgi:hypothetical protein